MHFVNEQKSLFLKPWNNVFYASVGFLSLFQAWTLKLVDSIHTPSTCPNNEMTGSTKNEENAVESAEIAKRILYSEDKET